MRLFRTGLAAWPHERVFNPEIIIALLLSGLEDNVFLPVAGAEGSAGKYRSNVISNMRIKRVNLSKNALLILTSALKISVMRRFARRHLAIQGGLSSNNLLDDVPGLQLHSVRTNRILSSDLPFNKLRRSMACL